MMKRILVPLDGSSTSECALPYAMSAALSFGAEIRLLTVLTTVGGGDEHVRIPDPVDWRFRRAQAQAYLSRMSTRVSEDGIPCESWLTEGEPAEAIVEAARQWSAELVVMATHGSGARNRCPSGSIASHVGARLDRSILMVSSSEAGIAPLRPHRYRRLLVPLDCSPRSNAVVQIAVALARPCEAEIVLAHVVPVPEMPRAEVLLDAEDLRVRDLLVASNRRLAQRTLEGLSGGPRSLSIPTRTRMEDSAHVSQALFRLVEEEAPDLVLMSAHGCGYAAAGVPAWPYGSVSGHMLMYGPVPRMIVKDEATRPQPVNRDRASAAVPGRQPLIG